MFGVQSRGVEKELRDIGPRTPEGQDMDLDTLKSLAVKADTKIILLVLDGLGDLPREPGGPTPLEAARTPNMDALAVRGASGLVDPVGPGITPGSGPGHLGLFGYDPLKYRIGRGVLEALGIDLELTPRDVAARGNFCTMDEAGRGTDRRAGRLSTERCIELSRLLDAIRLEGGGGVMDGGLNRAFTAVGCHPARGERGDRPPGQGTSIRRPLARRHAFRSVDRIGSAAAPPCS